MNLNILFIDDEEKIRDNLVKIFNMEPINGHTLIASAALSFDDGIKKIQESDYDIIILDLCQGELTENVDKPGYTVLKKIQETAFVPVIFYSGLTKDLTQLSSKVVGVVNKGDGVEKLKAEIERIISSNLAIIKSQVYAHIKETLRKYFWETVHSENTVFIQGKNEVSLGYLLLRRIANSLSKENIKHLLGDSSIKADKAHPMEFYIYPTENGEYETGEILLLDKKFYAILTPSCDFIEDKAIGRDRRVGPVLLVTGTSLTETEYYKDYKKNNNKTNKDRLARIIETRKGDQYFFLPGTPFIENLVLDFQNKIMVDYKELGKYKRVAKLDDPYTQSMVASFIRYYNRIGSPDIDAEFIINSLP